MFLVNRFGKGKKIVLCSLHATITRDFVPFKIFIHLGNVNMWAHFFPHDHCVNKSPHVVLSPLWGIKTCIVRGYKSNHQGRDIDNYQEFYSIKKRRSWEPFTETSQKNQLLHISVKFQHHFTGNLLSLFSLVSLSHLCDWECFINRYMQSPGFW